MFLLLLFREVLHTAAQMFPKDLVSAAPEVAGSNCRLKFSDAAAPEWLRSESQAPQRLHDRVPFQRYPGPRASCLGLEGSNAATLEPSMVHSSVLWQRQLYSFLT